MVRAISSADPFPSVVDPVAALARFDEVADATLQPLRAVLAVGDEPDFAAMRTSVADLLSPSDASQRRTRPSTSVSSQRRAPTDRSCCSGDGPTCLSGRDSIP